MSKIDMDVAGAAIVAAQLEDISAQLEGEVVYVVGTPVEYSVYQEVGTSFHRAQPYMRPAVEDAERALKDEFEDAEDMEKALDALAELVEKRAKGYAPVDTGRLRDSIEKERRK